MSINPLSNVSSIWSRASTALTTTPDATSLPPAKATNPKTEASKTEASSGQTASASTPFQKLSSDLQSVLLQLQSGQSQQVASLGQAPTGAAHPARFHGHHNKVPAADQPARSPLSALA